MNWHVDESMIDRYLAGFLDRAAASSVEAHVTACDSCRVLVTADEARLSRSWHRIVERVEPGERRLVERVLSRLGVPGHVARLVAVSPAMRASFVLAVVLGMGFAVAAAGSDPGSGRFRWFLLVAPLVPVGGVAFAYGRFVDPVHEVTLAAPIDSFRLVLLRAATVLAVAMPVGLAAWPLVPAPAALGVSAWLVPGLALTLATLSLASRLEPWIAGAVIALAWVGFWQLASVNDIEPYGAAAQAAAAVVAVAAGLVLVVWRDRFDRDWSRR